MVPDGELLDGEGLPIQPWEDEVRGEPTELNERAELTVGLLSEGRIVEISVALVDGNCEFTGIDCLTDDDCLPKEMCLGGCTPGVIGPGDAEGVEIEYCPEGTQVSLFPSARLYVEMTVTDPDATFFNPDTGEMEQGPLDVIVFFQVPGQKPDCNKNGVDDGIEILEGTLEDENNNGVPDQCELGAIPTVSEWGMIVMTVLALAAGTILFTRRRLATS